MCALEVVLEFDRRFVRIECKAMRMRAAAGIRVLATGAGIERLGSGIRCLRQHRAAATAGIDEPSALQIRKRLAVFVYSIGLEMNISIPFEAKTLERALELIREARKGPLAIEIVNPQQPTARRGDVRSGSCRPQPAASPGGGVRKGSAQSGRKAQPR